MLVTCFTDASFSRAIRRATWAAWFKYDGQTWRYSGAVRSLVENSGDGELAAIANALYFIGRELNPPANSRIIVQTDSQEAISAIRTGEHPRLFARNVVRHIKSQSLASGWLLDLRHVAGHKGTRTRRNTVNTLCDQECKIQMGRLLEAEKSNLEFAQPSLDFETNVQCATR